MPTLRANGTRRASATRPCTVVALSDESGTLHHRAPTQTPAALAITATRAMPTALDMFMTRAMLLDAPSPTTQGN